VMFRIAQEVMTNTIRHARARQAWIRLDFTTPQLCMEIEDDGTGFDVEKAMSNTIVRPCWGLLGIMERAALIGGTCQILSQPGKGTLVIVCVPQDEEIK